MYSVAAGRCVFVVSERHQLGADESLLGHELDPAGMANQLRGQKHRDVFDVLASVGGCVLSFEVGVDRHL